ncbi:MAG: outer membrane lipoprotein carrier protein LolA [Gemmatimonadaceae bacterium]|nr:outer membrane lipoprotein carrier protein LolA [Gemmatimonadaceae bacterium]
MSECRDRRHQMTAMVTLARHRNSLLRVSAFMTTLTRFLKRPASVLVAGALCIPFATTHAQSPAEASYARVAQAWKGTRTLEANFEQKITNPIVGRSVSSSGVFQQERPGKLAITFTQPAGDRIVGDGKSLWVYLPSSTPGQVLKLPASADGAIVADMLGQLLDTPTRAFAISGGEAATIEGRSTRRVQLLPRTAGSVPFQKAVLWLDDKEPRPVRVQVVDGQGVDRTITLTTWRPDATLPANTFTFQVPKGVKVSTKLPGS